MLLISEVNFRSKNDVPRSPSGFQPLTGNSFFQQILKYDKKTKGSY